MINETLHSYTTTEIVEPASNYNMSSSPVVNTTNSIQQARSVQSAGQPSRPPPTLNCSESSDAPIRSFVGSGFMITSSENNFQDLCNLVDKLAVETSSINIGNYHSRMLTILNTCQCCERHQINKPTVYEQWVETTFHGTPNTHLECSCSCRHLARNICRWCIT